MLYKFEQKKRYPHGPLSKPLKLSKKWEFVLGLTEDTSKKISMNFKADVSRDPEDFYKDTSIPKAFYIVYALSRDQFVYSDPLCSHQLTGRPIGSKKSIRVDVPSVRPLLAVQL